MPWEKRFDVDQARQKAMETFWSHGYDATSIQDLLDATGIQRGSFYDTFTSKRQLLLDALKQYDATKRRVFLNEARRAGSPKERVAWFFRRVVEESTGTNGRRGCFVVNCALEIAPRDREVAEIINRYSEEIEHFFRSAIDEGKKSGEIPPRVQSRATSHALLGLLLGIRVLSRSSAAHAAIEAIAKQAVALLD